MTIRDSVGQKIQQLREAKTLSRPELARRSNISRSHLFHIEQGQMLPGLGTLEKISRALEVGLGSFLSPKSEMELLLQDEFIPVAHPFVHRLNHRQRQLLLETLQVAPRKNEI